MAKEDGRCNKKFDWLLDYSLDHDPLIYKEESGLLFQ
jgi:hypothetical protein